MTPLDHPILDRPIWHALSTLQRSVSVGTERARRFHPDIGPLAATIDDEPESLADLADLIVAAGGLGLMQAIASPVPPGCREEIRAPAVQMVLESPDRLVAEAAIAAAGIDPLGDADAGDMLALATATAPGPFAARTHTLGRFWGGRNEGRLVAMAGERMRLPGLTEVSGVCTHPDVRGRGLAAILCSRVARDVLARGDRPFLHAFASNTGAIALYERLGFTLRREMTFVLLRPA